MKSEKNPRRLTIEDSISEDEDADDRLDIEHVHGEISDSVSLDSVLKRYGHERKGKTAAGKRAKPRKP